MFLIANTFAICFNKDYLLTYLQFDECPRVAFLTGATQRVRNRRRNVASAV